MKVCAEPGCPELVNSGRCAQHAPKPWRTGQRTDRQRISGWARQRRDARVMRRHGGICHVCGQPGADQVDHVTPIAEDGDDDESNLAPIHTEPCHRLKTAAEAARARHGEG